MSDDLEEARGAYQRRDWAQARELFTVAWEHTELAADDLNALADAVWWLGLADEALTARQAAYYACMHEGGRRPAAEAAMQVGYLHFLRGEHELGSGWLSRAGRLLAHTPDCVEQGYLRYVLDVEAALDGPDLERVVESAREVAACGERHGDPDLLALATAGQGRALVRLGQVPAGLALLDEAMAAIHDGRLSAEWAGNIYCNLVATCHELADLRRMSAWTRSLARWCAAQPTAILFTGICRVHQAQLLQERGAWQESEQAARQVCADLAELALSTTAEAHYVLGDLYRLRGDLPDAQREYDAAHEFGRDPQPGLALLRLAQGKADIAARSVQAALTACDGGALARTRLCAAQVEIALRVGAVDVARKASDELAMTAQTFGTEGLRAMAEHASGAVLLAEGQPNEALPALRRACRTWRELESRYACARARQLLAQAYDMLGDADSALRERDAVTVEFTALGAAGDLRPSLPSGLTAREAEILALVSAGCTNREIASALVLSPKTVSRHLSNIFSKIGVSTRTEAAAYAFAHGISQAPAR